MLKVLPNVFFRAPHGLSVPNFGRWSASSPRIVRRGFSTEAELADEATSSSTEYDGLSD